MYPGAMNALLRTVGAALLLLAGCTGPSSGGADLAVDMQERVDQARADLGTPPDGALSDSRAGDAAGVVVCNLGNDPLPCTNESTCTPNGATCDGARRYCVCLTPNCTPGDDKTCNDDPGISALHGRCVGSGSCMCLLGPGKSPLTGKCL